ncbi:mCG148127 [Mus musculus]|nr:mCG148127 [Mus musculus]
MASSPGTREASSVPPGPARFALVRAQPGAPGAPGEAQSRGAGTGGPGPNPAARDPQGQGEQFLVQRRGICWAPGSCGKARETRGARGPGGSDAPVNPKLEPAFWFRGRLNCPESNLTQASTLAYGRVYSPKLSWS